MDDWLAANGLGNYADAFRAHDITPAELNKLTDADLRELGLTIGDRKRFRAALAKPPWRTGQPDTSGERRPMTVVFVDVIGSSAIGEQLDPEELLEVYRSYRAFCAHAIQRFDGFVSQVVGDGILAYFCYPVAHENDPERAVRACLAITSGISTLQTPAHLPLKVRIGIATGVVVVSNIAEGVPEKDTIVGSTPNLAARLQSLAPPNGIVVSNTTYARIGQRFECVPLGELVLRGLSGVHAAWQVLAEHKRTTRVLPRPSRLTTFHGRQEETVSLQRAWAQARAGKGLAVLITGAAGIGKSRLIEHFIDQNIEADVSVTHLSAAPLDQDFPLHPFKVDLAISVGIKVGDAPEVALSKLSASLHGAPGVRERALFILAGLLGLPYKPTATEVLKPEVLRQRTITLLAEQLLAMSEITPACLIVEDLQWLDPTSLEVLLHMVAQAKSHRLLLLLTAREEFGNPWQGGAGTEVLPLFPLPDANVHALLQGLFAAKDVSDHLLWQLAKRVEGVPLFAEEIARELLQGGQVLTSDNLDQAAIPTSLHESLIARLDHAGPAKRVAQLAAVIGPTVNVEVLREAAALPDIDELVGVLINQGLLRQSPGGSLKFAHGLMRDAAYDSLLRDTRIAMHQTVAVAFERLQPDLITREPETLAFHLGAAGHADRAAELWLAAARIALLRAALTEASRLLHRGLQLLEQLPPSPDRLERRLRMMAMLGPVLIGVKGSKAAETQALYARGLELGAQLPSSASQYPIAWGWWRVSPDFKVHLQRSAVLLTQAKHGADPEQLLQAHHCCWASYYHAGDFVQCEEHLKAGLDLYNSGDFRHHARLYGNHDPKACAHGEFARMLWMKGYLIQSAAHDRLSLEWARSLNHVGSLVHALDSSMFIQAYRRDLEAVGLRAGELIRFTSEHEIADHGASGHILIGWREAVDHHSEGGLRRMEEGLTRHRAVATYEDFPVYACLLAEVLVKHGQPERAAVELARERAEFERIGLRIWLSEVIRMQAETANSLGNTEEAAAFLIEAEEVASQQASPMLRLRNAVTLASLPDTVRDPRRARELIFRAIRAVPEPDDSIDFKRARDVLTRL